MLHLGAPRLRAGGHDPDREAEAEKARIAVRQLERVEDYLVAALNLEPVDPQVRRSLNLIRGDVLALRTALIQRQLLDR